MKYCVDLKKGLKNGKEIIMYIKKLKLINFRNYNKVNITFTKGINIIYGKNAQGKTNLLESIYVLGLTKSHRNNIDNSLIKSDAEYLFIEGTIKDELSENKYNIYIDKNTKKIKYNSDSIKKISDYISLINIIIFYPDDLDLIKGSPKIRRKFLNMEISQLYSNYYVLINEYDKLLKIRNEYLKKGKIDLNYLEILTNYLIDKSINIYKLRYKYIKKINEYSNEIFKNIMGLDNFFIKYNPNIDIDINSPNIKDQLKEEYKKKLDYDIKTMQTNIGPHKDDFSFMLNGNDLKYYGSQGQQRIAVLSFKLSEIELFKKFKNTTPILLLDDIFSELDDNKKNNLLKYINKKTQTIITTTELNNIDKNLINISKLFNIDKGKIKKIREVDIYE